MHRNKNIKELLSNDKRLGRAVALWRGDWRALGRGEGGGGLGGGQTKETVLQKIAQGKTNSINKVARESV